MSLTLLDVDVLAALLDAQPGESLIVAAARMRLKLTRVQTELDEWRKPTTVPPAATISYVPSSVEESGSEGQPVEIIESEHVPPGELIIATPEQQAAAQAAAMAELAQPAPQGLRYNPNSVFGHTYRTQPGPR